MNTPRGTAFFLVLGCLAGLFDKSATAQVGGWTSRGLEGLSIRSLVVDPSSPSRIYAAAGADGIYRSADGGESWTPANFGASVDKLEIDERDGTIYAIAGERFSQQLYRSSDRGMTWTKFNFTGGFWNGREWTSSNTAEPVWSVAVNPNEAGVLHAGHSGASVSTSRDRGATWSHSYFDYYCSDFCAEAITTLTLDPANPSTIYAGIDADYDYPGFASLFKSTDGGKSWKQSDAGVVLWSSVYSIAVDPGDSQRVVAGASGYQNSSPGTYLSEDAGQTWRRTSDAASRALAFDRWNPQVLYSGTDKDGVLRSVDRGRSWSPMNSGLPSPRILSLAMDRARGLLLAGTRNGVYGYPIANPHDAFIDLFDAGSGTTGFVEVEAFGRFRVGTADTAGGKVLGPAHGPYAGWTPQASASGADGAVRVLWNHEDGSAAVWRTRAGAVETAFPYPAVTGWTAKDVTAGADGSTRLLWTAGGGAVSLLTVDGAGVRTNRFEYGPYEGWSAAAIADGPDGRTRLLWNKADGATGLSFFDSSGMLDSHRYRPGEGGFALDLAVGEDNRTRILRVSEDGQIAVWTIDANGDPVTFGTVYATPPGFRATRLSAGSDGLSRVLWRNPDGLAIVWLMSEDGEYQSSFALN